MRKIWSFVNGMKLRARDKYSLFLSITAVISALCGVLLWVIFGRVLSPDIWWLFCFAGYPAVFIGFFGGCFYLYNHEF